MAIGIGDASFLVPAAGAGERLGFGCKGLLQLHGRPLLRWIVDKALRVADEVSVARLSDGFAVEALPRHEAGVFQSPQAFGRTQLLERARSDGWQPQSTMQLALRAGQQVAAVAGEKTNFKITTAEDWRMAATLEDYLQ